MKNPTDRRTFLGAAATAGAFFAGRATRAGEAGKPALLGGEPVRRASFPGWPRTDARDENNLLEVLRSGRWFRGGGDKVNQFETAFAELTGAKHCVAVANGTSALTTTLSAIGVGPGDEVIVPPYTFIATVNAVMLQYALPVFVDVDPETFQIDHAKIEAAVTDRTTAVVPVHLGGSPANLDAILETASKRKLSVVEDACQAHLAEWRGRKVGTLGTAGCFSFQVSKNLSSGEGGAILTNDGDLAERCYAFQNNNRGRAVDSYNFRYVGGRATNLRLTEFQGALLLAQLTRFEQQSATREQNAAHLTSLLREIPGIAPAKMHEGVTRNAYHLYMFRYHPDAFASLPRARFLEALKAEGIPASGGYSPLNRESFLQAALDSKGFRRVFPKEVLDGYRDRSQCPANDRLCEEAVWFTQNMLLGTRGDMEQIAAAVRKIQAHGAELAKA
ncbi:MAG: DegT/DnrJ/EryC1/StrS family aminotransferase [Paludisphaera borealis]|uniref:DegT/DnrJ/EryC1/StrS family aminotransferase n=1 Tax=Paludisphaera borealis TaxID=1387353 RepID=UPI0028457C33|nr:DegT/DnrJ/EryC1/StrS family aminotransferase [Paludisphaera borealis]MDR3621585.1 DegT/DnrJ/EryC1/StrS family aminotransferase [Paludisphaera borealis]